MSPDYVDRRPKATVHFCDPATMDHPLHRLVGMRRAGWWVLTQDGCIGDVHGPFASRELAEAHGQVFLGRFDPQDI